MLPFSDRVLSILRGAGALAIAVAAVVVWATMGSSEKSDAEYLDDVRLALLKDRVNQKSADSSPQQTVVNGWTATDLLATSAKIQAANTRDDDRIGAELTLLVLAVAWFMLTSPRPAPAPALVPTAGPDFAPSFATAYPGAAADPAPNAHQV